MKRDSSASQRRGQGQHPESFGLPVHQCTHVLGLLSMRALNLRRISDHKVRFFVEECFQCFLRIIVLQEALDAFVTGGFIARHSGSYIAQTG